MLKIASGLKIFWKIDPGCLFKYQVCLAESYKTPAPNFMDANWLQTERYCNEKIKLAATFELCYLQPFCSQKATIFQPCLRWLQIGGKWLQIGCMLELWPLQHLYSQKAAFLQQKSSLFAAMPLHAWTLTFAAPLQTKSSLFAAKKQSFCSHASDGCKLEAHGCKFAECLTFAAPLQPKNSLFAAMPPEDITTPEEGQWWPKAWAELQYPVSAMVKLHVI